MNAVTASTAPVASAGRFPKPVVIALAGAFVANLSGQFATSQLADIQGAVGASADEISWITTAYTMASFAGIIVSPVLLRTLGLRRYFTGSAVLFALLAWAGAFAESLPSLLLARTLQGFAGGAFGPIAFGAVFVLCKGPRLAWGVAWLAFVLLVSVNAGPVMAGPLEYAFGWRGLFLAQAWMVIALAWLGWRGMPASPLNRDGLKSHWPAATLLVIATASAALVLSQGARRFWLENPVIAWSLSLSIGAALGFALLQRYAPVRIIDTRKLFERGFGIPILLNLIFRASFAATVYLLPLLLAQAQGYRPLQISQLLWWCLLPQIAAFPLVWQLLHRVDARVPMVGGLLLVVLGLALAAVSSNAVAGEQLRASLVLLGVGQMLFLVSALLAGALPLKAEDGPTATIAFNLTTIGGTTLGTGLLTHFAVEREKFHSSVLVEHVNWLTAGTNDRIAALTHVWSSRLAEDPATGAALTQLAGAVRREAWLLAANDAFALLALVIVLALLLIAFLGPIAPLPRSVEGDPS